MSKRAPILEFDPNHEAIISPNPYRLGEGIPVPAVAVMCFFNDILTELASTGELTPLLNLNSEIGNNPVYAYKTGGRAVTVVHPGVGAPLAAGFLDELIAIGVTRYVVCGGAGVLDKNINVGHPVILTSAVRDEGTSYHYLRPSREVKPHRKVVKALEKTFKAAGLEYRLGKAWTTDAPYRETKDKRLARMEEGCEVVEMEAAALFAVAKFREVMLGEVVYGGDLVVPEGWDHRDWVKRGGDRRLLFDLSVKAARLLF